MKRYVMIDTFKCIACYAVICLHALPFEPVVLYNQPIGKHLLFFIDTVSRFAVPFFFMASGFMYIKKTMNSSNAHDYFRNYAVNLALLYFGWCIFYAVYTFGIDCLDVFANSVTLSLQSFSVNDYKNAIKLLYQVFYSGGYVEFFHLWFLIALLWSIIILHFCFQHNKLSVLLAISLLLYIFGLFGDSYRGLYSLPFRTRTAIFFGLFYCTLGGFIAFHEERVNAFIAKWGAMRIGFAIILFGSLQLVERFILIQQFHGTLNDNFFIMTLPFVVCLFFFSLGAPPRALNEQWITSIADKVVGIYLIHPIVMEELALVGQMMGIDGKSFIYQAMFVPLVFLFSFLIYKYIILIYHWSKMQVKAVMNG